MASILESYQVEVLALLKKGATYQAVCAWLAEKKGVSITKQSVCSWYTRRCKRILKRKQQQNGVLPLLSQSKSSHETKVSLSISPKSLDTLIQESERQCTSPHVQYIVKPKQQGLTNEVSTRSKGLKK